MSDSNVLIEQMVADISSQALRLDNVRLQLFLKWLNAHSITVKVAKAQSLHLGQVNVTSIREEKMTDRLKACLQTLFEALPVQDMLWEYRFILDEIAWWHDLDARRLAMILRSETRN